MTLGELHDLDGRWQLRFTRHLPHPPQKVWRALTEPEHLGAWFPAEIHGDRRPGAALTFVFAGGEGPTTSGEMLIYEPPAALEVSWGDDRLRFELAPEADGTVLTFLSTFGALGRASRDGTGWHACLDLLAYDLADETPPWDPGQRWVHLHPSYLESFGPEASTIGPPPGNDPRE
ncbi:MAG: hypothetical protein QOC93_610 [Actinomycetota bacterium]|jgi:uncharacterized protein YndB with AHSA1/START domain|nr:hypothetical protein [Actinomycetota bacterium]